MAIIEQGKCTIHSLNNRGLGISQTDLGPVLLPYTLPGEAVEFERHKYRRTSNCVLKKVIEFSATRATPSCQYFGACGGCLLQHLGSDDYHQFKYDIIHQALQTHDIRATINPVITIPAGMRRRANLEAIKKDEQIFLGFHRFHSHQIINIDQCPALLPQLSNLLRPLKEVLSQILTNRQKAQIFLTKASNGTDISFTIQEQSKLADQHRLLLADFAKEHAVTRLIFRYRKSADVIWEVAKPHIIFDEIAVETDAYGFLQASFPADKILAELVLNFITGDIKQQPHIYSNDLENWRVKQGVSERSVDKLREHANLRQFYDANSQQQKSIVDLFCGRGTYTIPLSRNFKVDGFESDDSAISALKKAISSTERLVKVTKRDLFSSPLNKQELNQYEAAVINPPRAGAQAQCYELKSSDIDKICYISCNPETFAVDAKILCAGGYELNEVTPVDQFYWSPHLEVIGFFRRNERI